MAARAKKKITTTTEEVDDEDIEASGAEKLDDEVIRALTELEGASDITWQVHRMGSVNPGYCRPPMTTPELTLENIARRHGPGHYRIKGVKADGTYFKSATITIAEPNEPANKTDALLAALKGGGTDQNVLLAIMQMQSQAQQAASAAQAQIMSALIAKPESKMPWGEIAAVGPPLLLAIKELFARKDESGEAMDKFLKTLTIVEKLRGDDRKEGSTWTDIIRDALPSLSTLVSRGPASNGHAVPATGAHSAPAVLSPASDAPARLDAPTPEAVAVTPELMTMQWLQAQLNTLIEKAAANRNAALYAELLLEELPSYIPDSVIVELLSRNDWFERLCQFDPRVAPYRGWFENFTEATLQLLNDEPNPSSSEEPAP